MRAGSSQPRLAPGSTSLRDGVAGPSVAVQQSSCPTAATSAVQGGDDGERYDTRFASALQGFGRTENSVRSACQARPRFVSFAGGGGAEERATGDRRGSQSAGRWKSLRESRSRAAYQRGHLLQPCVSGRHSSGERGEYRLARDGAKGGDFGARGFGWRIDQGLEIDHQGAGAIGGGGGSSGLLWRSRHPGDSALASGCTNVDGRHASRVPTYLSSGGRCLLHCPQEDEGRYRLAASHLRLEESEPVLRAAVALCARVAQRTVWAGFERSGRLGRRGVPRCGWHGAVRANGTGRGCAGLFLLLPHSFGAIRNQDISGCSTWTPSSSTIISRLRVSLARRSSCCWSRRRSACGCSRWVGAGRLGLPRNCSKRYWRRASRIFTRTEPCDMVIRRQQSR